jgi:putative restriction endonuclease
MLAHRYGIDRERTTVEGIARTGSTLREVEQRIGHQAFSDNVKDNFNYNCCFPKCAVEGRNFLVSGHIARWADNEPLRGHTANGLCFCLMHDKAFEQGLFTLDENLKVVIVKRIFEQRQWLADLLQHGENLEIKPRKINPLVSH